MADQEPSVPRETHRRPCHRMGRGDAPFAFGAETCQLSVTQGSRQAGEEHDGNHLVTEHAELAGEGIDSKDRLAKVDRSLLGFCERARPFEVETDNG